jgi:hypothetical protein
MAYPWASYGNVKWLRSEIPIRGTDTRWSRRNVSRDVVGNLGSTKDSIVTLALRSAVRTWEAWYDVDRFSLMESLVGTIATLTDWDQPVPQERAAYLERVEFIEQEYFRCAPGETRLRYRARLDWISQ